MSIHIDIDILPVSMGGTGLNNVPKKALIFGHNTITNQYSYSTYWNVDSTNFTMGFGVFSNSLYRLEIGSALSGGTGSVF